LETDSSRPNGETILLVEDHPELRTVASRILRRHGYVVHVATTGQEALRLLEELERVPDLLLTDGKLPDCDGRDLARQIRSSCPGIKVLLSSGSMEESDGDPGVPFLPKPYSMERLTREVRAVLDAG
jgi:two-component system, cell cycle sensor histidine kinase and response regulator CckA